jgi:hypothetical protein
MFGRGKEVVFMPLDKFRFVAWLEARRPAGITRRDRQDLGVSQVAVTLWLQGKRYQQSATVSA